MQPNETYGCGDDTDTHDDERKEISCPGRHFIEDLQFHTEPFRAVRRFDQRGLAGNSQNARKFIVACNTMHQIIPKRILAKAKMKPEMICGNTKRGASIKVSLVNSGNRKLEM